MRQHHQPLVSVIIATYNRSNIIGYTISSVLSQTYQNFEIIVVGDCCTDDTRETVEAFKDARISFNNLEQNSGEQSYPNNVGLSKSRGELICWLNHDDLWFSDHLSSLVEVFNNPVVDFAFSWYFLYQPENFGLTHALPVCSFPYHFIPASTWMVKKSVACELGGWTLAKNTYDVPSQDFTWRIYKTNKNVQAVSKLTVIAIQSGARKNSYLERQYLEHEIVFQQLKNPLFREQLLTDLCYQLALNQFELSLSSYLSYLLKLPLIALAKTFKLNIRKVKLMFVYNRKGGLIKHLRKVRGIK